MHSNNKTALAAGLLPSTGECLSDFRAMDRALGCVDRLRALLRLWALSAEQLGQVSTADRQELLLSALELAESAREDLVAAMPEQSL